MKTTLRDYQKKAVAETLQSLKSGKATLLVSPTGAGKTVMAAQVAKRYERVLVVAHRSEIIEQAREQFGPHVNACSVLSALHRGPKKVDLLIIDEAHRSAARTYRELIHRHRHARRLGLTATPLRTDGQGLCDAFDVIVESAAMSELIDGNYIVPCRSFEAPDEALKQLIHIKRQGGDYASGELSKLMNQPRLVGNVVREYLKHAAGRKAVVFAVSIDHSRTLTEAFLTAGVKASHLDGRSSDKHRSNALTDLANGRIDVLCNVNLFTEGWDCPPVSCVIMARPTVSLTLYLQSIGRGMRTAPGKNDLLVLDHAGNIERHGLPENRREWKLESDRQAKAREKNQLELDRLRALGFESLEEYELEQKRIREESYSLNDKQIDLLYQAIGGSSKHRNNAAAKIIRWGIEAIDGSSRRGPRFPKDKVDELICRMSKAYSIKECATVFGISRHRFWKLSKDVGLEPFFCASNTNYYWKRDVDDLKRQFDDTYAPNQCWKIVMCGSSKLASVLQANGIAKAFGASHGIRYWKADIDRLGIERRAMSQVQAA